MRTSRDWIAKTVMGLEGSAPWNVEPAVVAAREDAGSSVPEHLTLEFDLSPEEARALEEICREDELSPRQALASIVRARLLGRPQFGRSDRARLRACLDLLRAIEQHIGRAARPVGSDRQAQAVVATRMMELLDLGGYVRQVCRAIGESMTGNLQYWREGTPTPPREADPARGAASEAVGPNP